MQLQTEISSFVDLPSIINHWPLNLLMTILLCTLSCEAPMPHTEGSEANPDHQTPCSVITCSNHGICVMLNQSPTCACDEGYQADPVNGLACIEVFNSSEQNSPSIDIDQSMIPNDMGQLNDQIDLVDVEQSQDGGPLTTTEMAGEMAGTTADEMAGTTADEMAGVDLIDIGCNTAPEAECLEELDSENSQNLCDGLDNDCDGQIDEGCYCKAGEVRTCFSGPVNRLGIGACSAGTMRCIEDGPSGSWGPCENEVKPREEICDGLDNDCNTCVDEIDSCEPELTCPGPNDPRTPTAVPFEAYRLFGSDFYTGAARTWNWSIIGGPCDLMPSGRSSFQLVSLNESDALFTPTLSGSYQVTLTIITETGERIECTWIIHVRGPGLRVEMCYPESTYLDLDLLVMRHSVRAPWYQNTFDPFSPSPLACSWANCEATIRGFGYSRVDWGYATSPIQNCLNTPQGDQWSRNVGHCANPRLDIDNNLSEGTGVPENINIDLPDNHETYRIMVHNFSGGLAHPLVNIYCNGERRATLGAEPDQVPNFQGNSIVSIGAMWRVVDVTTIVNENGITTDCLIDPLHPPGHTTGFDISQEDPRF